MDTNTGIESKARELLEGRVQSVTALSSAVEHFQGLRDRATEAERDADAAWSAATDAGWTESELRTLGFARPTTKRIPRTTRRRQQTPRSEPSNADQQL